LAIKDYSNRKCVVTGCPNLGAYKHLKDGRVYRSPLCGKHSKIRWGNKRKHQPGYKPTWLRNIQNTACVLCKWDRSNVDAHRVIHGKDGGKYKQDNVIGLCPNCHRLVHKGVIKL
jgi:hypothetical protein